MLHRDINEKIKRLENQVNTLQEIQSIDSRYMHEEFKRVEEHFFNALQTISIVSSDTRNENKPLVDTPESVLSAARLLKKWCDRHFCRECPLYDGKCITKEECLPCEWNLPKEVS